MSPARHHRLDRRLRGKSDLIELLVHDLNPHLVEALGVGPEVAGQLLVTAGDNPERMRSQGAFGMLPGSPGSLAAEMANQTCAKHVDSFF